MHNPSTLPLGTFSLFELFSMILFILDILCRYDIYRSIATLHHRHLELNEPATGLIKPPQIQTRGKFMEKPNLMEKQAKTECKKPYEPPKAIFIQLRMEERLMACIKQIGATCPQGSKTS
jgi:hypothetical protein